MLATGRNKNYKARKITEKNKAHKKVKITTRIHASEANKCKITLNYLMQ